MARRLRAELVLDLSKHLNRVRRVDPETRIRLTSAVPVLTPPIRTGSWFQSTWYASPGSKLIGT